MVTRTYSRSGTRPHAFVTAGPPIGCFLLSTRFGCRLLCCFHSFGRLPLERETRLFITTTLSHCISVKWSGAVLEVQIDRREMEGVVAMRGAVLRQGVPVGVASCSSGSSQDGCRNSASDVSRYEFFRSFLLLCDVCFEPRERCKAGGVVDLCPCVFVFVER